MFNTFPRYIRACPKMIDIRVYGDINWANDGHARDFLGPFFFFSLNHWIDYRNSL